MAGMNYAEMRTPWGSIRIHPNGGVSHKGPGDKRWRAMIEGRKLGHARKRLRERNMKARRRRGRLRIV